MWNPTFFCLYIYHHDFTIMLVTITTIVFQITILMLHVIVATIKQSKIFTLARKGARPLLVWLHA
jgi:hypothetical protein